jgi:hypothetical protein
VIAVAGFEHDRGAALAAALQVQPPAAADLHQPSEIALSSNRRRRGRALGAEDDDGTEQDGKDAAQRE